MQWHRRVVTADPPTCNQLTDEWLKVGFYPQLYLDREKDPSNNYLFNLVDLFPPLPTTNMLTISFVVERFFSTSFSRGKFIHQLPHYSGHSRWGALTSHADLARRDLAVPLAT